MTMDLARIQDLDFRDKRVTVVGLGVEGVDVVRYLSRRGADITVSDSKPPEKLAGRMEEVAGLPVRFALGTNDEKDITEADALFVSQGVPLDLPPIQRAREKGVPLHSMLGLFLDLCPGPVAGITGSSGKTTTTALVGEMLRADERPVFIGGNIGVGLLDPLTAVRPYTWTVLEVSHTQLQLVDRSPHVAAVLNITPNHLDRFSWEDYKHLKANLIRYQEPGDIAVLGYDDPEARALRDTVKGRVLWFSSGPDIPGEGVFVRDGLAVVRCEQLERPLFPLADIKLRGEHNVSNVLAAAAVATACGVTPEAIACAVEAFRGIPHRLEPVAEIDGVTYYNDSIATTPERTIAGLRSFREPVVALLGGRDKDLPMEDLANECARRCRAVIAFGAAADKIEATFRRTGAGDKTPVVPAAGLEDAVAAARATAQPGDVVLLSPACTSYDAYDNFERRGDHFRELVRQLTGEVQPSRR
jgi:UDP-N-acetylmuramoylalanine--D-glutamate ligase